MRELVEAILQDCSTQDVFCFSIRCDECGQVWHSRQTRFSKAGVLPGSEGKRVVFRTLYQKERDSARKAAVREATAVFNYCPICHRIVCNRCFLICEDLDMCVRCASELDEQGAPVMQPLTEENTFVERKDKK